MTLNIEKLGELVAKRRGTSGLRAAAQEIGIGAATLSRIENGQIPDLSTFALICHWLGEDPGNFLGFQNSGNAAETVSVHLRKRKTVSKDTAIALGGMILSVQSALKDREEL